MKKNKFYFLIVAFVMLQNFSFGQKPITGYSNTSSLIINPTNEPVKAIGGNNVVAEDKTPPIIAILSDYKTPQKSNVFQLVMRVTDNSEVKTVRINGLDAVKTGDKYHIDIQLAELRNEIKITATDKHWNESTENIVIKREQRFDRTGKDRALLFAVEDYEHTSKLYKPIDDALALKEILETSYGFTVELIRNPSLEIIRNKLNDYAHNYNTKKLNKDGQLVVFFSGHGYEGNKTGFFVPKDGESANKYGTCFSYNEMREKMSDIDVKHKLLIVDACYSAFLNPEFDRTGPVFGNPKALSPFDKEMKQHKDNSSFEYITSDASGKTTPDNSQLMVKFFEGLKYSTAKEGFIKLELLVPSYLKAANPQPYYNRLEENTAKTSFMFFKK